jgi:uncharacterized membrane protein YgaE (UPF0421/DUF939 family)
MFDAERDALRRTFVLSRPTVRETLAVAAVYAAQAGACVLLLSWAYHHTAHGGATWAVISAVLALQPGLSQSVVTSVVRVLANTVGATVGLAVGELAGEGTWQLVLAIAVVVPTCELLRLNLALRTACVAAIIVMTVGGADGHAPHLVATGAERFVATVVGCSSALLVQLLTDLARKALPSRSARPSPVVAQS